MRALAAWLMLRLTAATAWLPDAARAGRLRPGGHWRGATQRAPVRHLRAQGRIALEAGTDIDDGKAPVSAPSVSPPTAPTSPRARAGLLPGRRVRHRPQPHRHRRRSRHHGEPSTHEPGAGLRQGQPAIEATVGGFDEAERLAESRWITLGFRFSRTLVLAAIGSQPTVPCRPDGIRERDNRSPRRQARQGMKYLAIWTETRRLSA